VKSFPLLCLAVYALTISASVVAHPATNEARLSSVAARCGVEDVKLFPDPKRRHQYWLTENLQTGLGVPAAVEDRSRKIEGAWPCIRRRARSIHLEVQFSVTRVM
jgi:hypothetical protein